MMSFLLGLAEKGVLPTPLLRMGTRQLLRQRLQSLESGTEEERRERRWNFISSISQAPVALEVRKANEQHYELPPEFFKQVLGRRLKYSSAYFPEGVKSLDSAEDSMLELVCERAQFFDGMKLLDLGCGWGSLSLYVAQKYPKASVVGVSNSKPQREFILEKASAMGIKNLQIITMDMNLFSIDQKFDRIASIEMFEHMRNFKQLLAKVSNWLVPQGKLFIHVFCHREYPYLFESEGTANWMGKYFFTAGMMPFDEIFSYFQDSLRLERNWVVNGNHYAKTSRAWLERLDANRSTVMPILENTYGKSAAPLWFERWRLFFIACEETFGFRDGKEWWVSHSLLSRAPV